MNKRGGSTALQNYLCYSLLIKTTLGDGRKREYKNGAPFGQSQRYYWKGRRIQGRFGWKDPLRGGRVPEVSVLLSWNGPGVSFWSFKQQNPYEGKQEKKWIPPKL